MALSAENASRGEISGRKLALQILSFAAVRENAPSVEFCAACDLFLR